jgi:hypothetical protein
LSGGHFVELWKGVSELRAWVFRKAHSRTPRLIVINQDGDSVAT